MDKPNIKGFIVNLLADYREHDCMDIDGGDLHEMLLRHGLFYDRPITEEEAEESWAQEWGMEPGDTGTFPHPDIKALLDRTAGL